MKRSDTRIKLICSALEGLCATEAHGGATAQETAIVAVEQADAVLEILDKEEKEKREAKKAKKQQKLQRKESKKLLRNKHTDNELPYVGEG